MLCLIVALAFPALRCAPARPKPVSLRWWMGRSAPRFDPDGPPDAARWALERMLSRGLVDEDSSGRIVPAAALRHEYSPDSLTLTFHLRPALRFVNGARCGSREFRTALESGLRRTDHATVAWALAAVKGVDAIRARRPLPALGIETPDENTLVLRLSRPDPLLPRKLALPGVGVPFASRAAAESWRRATGLGPYRVHAEDAGRRLLLARAGPVPPGTIDPMPETLVVRFATGAGRARAALRADAVDLVWPTPPGLLGEPPPASHRVATRMARPGRRLVLVMRADLPPTSRLAARAALAHGVNRAELPQQLGPGAHDVGAWMSDAPAFGFPKLDAHEVAAWLERGKLGRSFHVVMTYDADGAGSAVARAMQGEWSRLGLYVDLLPLRGAKLADELLQGTRAHLALVEWQAPLAGPAAELAALVMPLRGPAVGAVRTGWRTREFDPWLRPRRTMPALDSGTAQARLERELIALPLAELDWTWVERRGLRGLHFHPHFGPECALPVTLGAPAR